MEKLLKEIEKNPKKHLNKISDKTLEKILDSASDYYYNQEPILSDDTYDFLENELKKRKPESDYFQRIGAPVRKDIVKTELPSWMGSLDKIYPNTRAFDLWFEKNTGPYFITQKLDGASGMISYQDGDIKIYTRGDGRVGQDISFLKDYLKIPKIKENILIRGEFIMGKEVFLKKYKDRYPKARTVVNSVINSKKPEREIINDIDFVVYELVEEEGLKWSVQFSILEGFGFQLPDYLVTKKITEEELRKIYFYWRQNSDYEIDGLVVSKDNGYIRSTSGNPKYSVAFKINLEGKETTVENVLWEVSKHGIIKPRVKFHPVILDGDVVNYATAFNAKFVEENNLGTGTVIKIVKSGDVIPYILSIEKSTKAQFPEVKYHWNETHVDIILDDLEISDDYKIKRIIHFFQTLRIPNISTGIVTKLYNFGYNTPKKICLMEVSDFTKISGVQEKSGRKLFQSIKSIIDKPIPLERIMAASLVFDNGFGEKRLKSILDVYPNFMKIYKTLKVNDIEKIEGFSEKTSKLFVKNIPDFIKFVEDLSFLKIKLEEKKSGILNGLNFVFSGFRDTELKEKIENQGGNVRDTVSTKTLYLIVKKIEENPTGKIKKANNLGISIISETDFKKKYNF
jgi:DNA ligase (NAD+)